MNVSTIMSYGTSSTLIGLNKTIFVINFKLKYSLKIITFENKIANYKLNLANNSKWKENTIENIIYTYILR